MDYREITCVQALNKLKRKIPYGWDLNIYRGCQHDCRYCYAMDSNRYLDSNAPERTIFIKTNVVEQLEKQLSHPDWKRDIINIGGVTDSYQPAEETFQLMPDILKLLIKYKTPAIISTKSDLILRDYDLIDQLSRLTYVNVAATITTMDEDLRGQIEPGAVASARRFEMLRRFRQTNASVGLHLMPIIPFLTDSYQNLNDLCRWARDCIVHYVLPGTLYLRGRTRSSFFAFIKQSFPDLFEPLQFIYQTGGASQSYKNTLYQTVNDLRDCYGLSSSYTKPMKEKMR